MDYNAAIKQITQARKAQLVNYELSLFDAINNNISLKQVDDEIKDLVLNAARGNKIDNAKLAELQSQKSQALRALKITPPPYHCKICKDTGILNAKACACAIKLTLSKNNDLGLPLQDFSKGDFSLFDAADAPRVKKVYTDVQTIINTYPQIKKRNIIIMGSTGTGKTYLAGAAANLMLQNNMSVMAMSAFALNNRFLKFHTTFDSSKADYLDPLLDCEALIIDDLGTESILKNITLEYLYQIINERTLANKFIFITTNLDPTAILGRYGARIYSRLFDKHLLYANLLTGKDLRDFK